MKLYAILLSGHAIGCHIESHYQRLNILQINVDWAKLRIAQ